MQCTQVDHNATTQSRMTGSGLGQNCLDSAQCDAGVLNAVCSTETGTCKCRNGDDNFGNQFCLKRKRLRVKTNTKRSIFQACFFIDAGSTPRQDPPIRRRLPGQSCTSSAECSAGANNATCTEAICQCNFGFVLIAADFSCRLVAALDEECSFTEQCSSLVSNSVCDGDRRRCKCQHGFIPLGDRCIAGNTHAREGL